MAPRIDPALPLVWRSPTTLQLGAAAPRVVVHDAGSLETGLISALRSGASVPTLRTIGGGLGASPSDVDALLAELAPAFMAEPHEPDAPAQRPTVLVDADQPLAGLVSSGLGLLGYEVSTAPADEAPDGVAAVVIGATWVVSPARHLPWLRRDVPHLAIVFDDEGVRVGPFVEPGAGPCLRCIDLARRDTDAAWPLIAAQLAGRPAATATTRATFDAATFAAALVDDRLRWGATPLAAASVRLSGARAMGQESRHPHDPHAECGCRAPGGIAMVPARLDAGRSRAPSSASSGAVPV